MANCAESFGSLVFNDGAMKKYLPEDTYNALRSCISEGKDMDLHTANIVAEGMKNWALENGASHFTHWFQPLTGATAEKHSAFLSPDSNGCAIMEFSGKELIKGEPDASSFPSGGLRATFEARGYTAWDTTSYAFIKEGTLCIPTAFCSYSGDALDKKTPLLKSMEALNEQALRILRLFGVRDVKKVFPSVGLEQEYFLVDKDLFLRRPDLKICGRTLIGAAPPKGQELDDHYFGAIRPRVLKFMKKLDEHLWMLGIPAKMEHNEAAPAQHELVSVHATANISVDQNQLMMEEMKKVADSMNLACLLHEKPFAGVNGSGKHNNWSLQTDSGVNLLEPGDSPAENAQFLLFLTAVLRAVDKYQALLRLSAASASNDCRLGGEEAPPSIISVFLGSELTSVMDSIAKGVRTKAAEKQAIDLSVHAIPSFPKDSTDRNRTSPMAFTGNKFEFRMLGSSFNAAGPNIVLNAAVAEVLSDFADKLEAAPCTSEKDFETEVLKLVGKSYTKHRKIVFNGNNYDEKWIQEAEGRGLANYRTTFEAAKVITDPKTVKMMGRFGVLGETELECRRDVILDGFCKTISIEARTLLGMVLSHVIPDSEKYLGMLVGNQNALENLGLLKSVSAARYELIEKLNGTIESLRAEAGKLMESLTEASGLTDRDMKAEFCGTVLRNRMAAIRQSCDWLEMNCPADIWSLPTYQDLLFSV